MPNSKPKTPRSFRDAAITSRLVTQAKIDEASRSLQPFGGGPPGSERKISDKQLADRLVEMGDLNRWQVHQLDTGRTMFNLNQYQIVDSLGKGGMGHVFKAEHVMLARTVAIKVLPQTKSNPESIDSFIREVRLHAQVDHENLVRCYDAGHDGNVYFMVTEYVPGSDLRQLINARGAMSMSEAATIVQQAAWGLSYAHEHGLIHRDIKPGNVMVTPESKTKLIDLGLASYFSDDNDPRMGKIVGTSDYLSPEQITSPRDITPVSDIYSLGCTLYYAVTGKVPFPGGSTRDKAHRHVEHAPLNPRRFNPDLTDEFLDLIADTMEKDPKLRCQSAQEVADRLAGWAGALVSPLSEDERSIQFKMDNSPNPSPAAMQDTHPDLLEPPAPK